MQVLTNGACSLVTGGNDNGPLPDVRVIGGGNADGAGGVVIVTIPATPYVDITTQITIDTVNGVTGGGGGFIVKF